MPKDQVVTNGLSSHHPLFHVSAALSGVRGSDASDVADAAARAASIVASLGEGVASAEEVFAAFEELDGLPVDVVRTALAKWTGPAPDPDRLDPATRSAHGFPPLRIRLRTISIVKDADLLDLGTVAEDQLRIAGKLWDGADLAAEERLDGEREGSFAGTLERRVLAEVDAGGTKLAPRFDVLLYAGDSGAIFRAGTTELVGAVAYGTVEMSDRHARLAIQEALAQFDVEALPSNHVAGVVPDEHAPLNEAPSSKDVATEPRPSRKAPKKVSAKESKKASAKSPKKASAKSPKVSAEAPKSSAKSSKMSAKAPKKSSAEAPKSSAKSSKMSAKAPKKSSAKAPKVNAKEPKVSAKAPKVSAKAPKSSAKAPKSSAKAPKSSAKAPKSSAKAPKSSAKSPAKTARRRPAE